MRKLLAGSLMLVFAGLLTTSVVTIYDQPNVGQTYLGMMGQTSAVVAY